jgi:hypothetical protein
MSILPDTHDDDVLAERIAEQQDEEFLGWLRTLLEEADAMPLAEGAQYVRSHLFDDLGRWSCVL